MIEFRSEALTQEHDTASFGCGVPPLDRWLRDGAWRAQRQNTARTFVWVRPGGHRVLAYFSTAATQVARAGLSSALAGGNTIIPGYLLARLALDRTLQGRGLGSELLVDALTRICRAAEHSAGRVVVVDPVDENAAGFYARHDFRPIGDGPRMVATVASIRHALGMA